MKLRLTKAGRVVLFILIAAVLCVGGYFGYQYLAGEGASLIENFGSDSLDSDISNPAMSAAMQAKIQTLQIKPIPPIRSM